MVIATFGPTTGWAGKTITYDAGQFTLEDFGVVTPEAVLEYDRQGHLVWAYDGLREWTQRLGSGQPAPAPTRPAQSAQQPFPAPAGHRRRGFTIAVIVASVLVGVIVLFAAVGAFMRGSSSDASSEAVTMPQVTQPPAQPGETQAAQPATTVHVFGQSQVIRSGSEALEVTPLTLTISKQPPAMVVPTQSGKGWVYAVVRVRFKNVGSKFTKSQVGMWSQLRCRNNAEDNVTAEWMGDMQGNAGRLELDPGQAMTWRVTFAVRRTAKPVSYSYQGPGDHTDTWTVN